MTNQTEYLAPHMTAIIPPPLALPDKWIAVSCLQKLIRRAEVDLAGRAAVTLWQIDRTALWKRLLVIAFEDIGIGDIDAVLTTTAATSAAWRKTVGDDPSVAVGVARMLASAVKNRGTESLWTTAAGNPAFAPCRGIVGSLSIPEKLAMVADLALPLPERAVAAWYASGVDHWPSNRVGRGDLPALLETYRMLGAPEHVLGATAMAIRKVREPIFTVFPLLAMIADRKTIIDIPPPPMAMVGDVPLCCLDGFTRTGKAAIKRFATANPAVSSMLNDLLPPMRWPAATAYAVFYCQSALITPKLAFKNAMAIEHLGIETDFLSVGFPDDAIPAFLKVVEAELPDLDSIRARMLAPT